MLSNNTRSLVREAGTQNIGDIPRRTAMAFPEKLGIVDGDTRLTFKEFSDFVDCAAAGMQADGLRNGDAVALLARNCWQFPVIAFAAARIGAITVPINYMLGASEISYILDHSECVAFIVEDSLTEVAEWGDVADQSRDERAHHDPAERYIDV